MTTALTTTPVQSSAVHSDLSARIASSAVAALTSEVQLRGKPGLVGPDGARGHADMDCDLMRLSADTLHPTFRALADHGAQLIIVPGATHSRPIAWSPSASASATFVV